MTGLEENRTSLKVSRNITCWGKNSACANYGTVNQSQHLVNNFGRQVRQLLTSDVTDFAFGGKHFIARCHVNSK